MVDAALFSSQSVYWDTPDRILDCVRDFAGAKGIGLDPCASPTSTVGAAVQWSDQWGDDGLARDWIGLGLVFVNFPYGRKSAGPWVDHIVRQAARGAEIITLAPARIDTAWCRELMADASAICTIAGRVHFLQNGVQQCGSPFPSILVYHGDRVRRFRECMMSLGGIWRLMD